MVEPLGAAEGELGEYLTAPHKSRGRRPVASASFATKMDERIRWRRYLLRCTDITPVSQPLVKKVHRDRIMARMKLPVPTKFVDNGTIAEVMGDIAARDRVVIKPVAGASSTGVMLLRRTREGWHDLRRDMTVADTDVKATMEAVRHRGQPVERWFAEQLVEGQGNEIGHPMDYKFYMFQKSCGLVLAKRHHREGHAFRWFGGEWEDVETGKYQKLLDQSIPVPLRSEQLLQVAQDIASAIPLPFVRVDLIDGDDGVFLSELSPLPGQYDRFNESVDHYLGFLWEVAEIDHCLDFLTSNQFAPCRRAIKAIAGVDKLWPA